MKRILFSLMTIIAVLCVAGTGSLAYLADTETSTGNMFVASGCSVVPMSEFEIDHAKLDFKDTGKCGGIASMTLEYSGGAGEDITVDKGTVTYNGDGTYTITPEDGKEKLSANTKIYVGGDFHTEIHTSCSQSINIGDVHGDFVIVDLDKLPSKDNKGNTVHVQGKLELDLVKGDGVDISEDVIVSVGPLSETITMVAKGDKWEYKRPKDGTGDIKHMTINWKNGTFDIRMDKADLSGVPNPVTISVQIGDDFGTETIPMEEKKHHWDYKAHP